MSALRNPCSDGDVATYAVAIMAKASEAGRTKTRLCPPLTLDEAAIFNTAFLKDMTAAVSRSAMARSVDVYLAYGPPGSAPFFERELPGVSLIETWFRDFGACLLHALRGMLARGHKAAFVLNSDSPTLPSEILVNAFDLIDEPGDRVVLGPSTDGGYYLLGLKADHGELFQDIAWSTDRVADQTRERAASLKLDLVELPVWYDVDDADSLRKLIDDALPERGRAARHIAAPATAEVLRRFLATADGPRRLGASS